MRYKKISPKDNKWTKTCQALKEIFETLRCSKCKNSLHDAQQFLPCGHFTCFSCIKNSNKCIECLFSVKNDVLKDETIQKIVQACCIIAGQVGFKELPNNGETTSEESAIREQTNSSNNLDSHSNNVNGASNQSKKKSENVLKRRNGIKTEIVAKKAKLEKITPVIRVPKNVDKKNHHGETKLQEECKKGRIDNVKVFLEAGANPNTCCNAGWTPLQECADFGYIEIAKLLLENGADINKKGYQGRTPLHEAIQANNIPMVKFLLQHEAKKDIEDDSDCKPIQYCKSEEIRMLLMCDIENGSPSTSRRARNNSVTPKRICLNGPGVSYDDFRNLSATNYLKIENECDNSYSDSEDDGAPYKERYSQNTTIPHQEFAYKTYQEVENEPLDSEEIDILN